MTVKKATARQCSISRKPVPLSRTLRWRGRCQGLAAAVESPSGLTLDNCHFNGSVTNVYHSAALVGFASPGADIEKPSITLNNCSANANITTTRNYIAGGLVAKGTGVQAYNCSFKGKVTSLGTVGGLIGVAINCNLENCFEGGYTYIDENSNNVYSTDYYTVLDNTMTTISAGWYVVNSDVTFNGNLSTNADGEVHIILCDGATLTANNITPIGHSDFLCIYGQSQSTGTANISGSIVASSSLQIYGGTINVTGTIDCPQGSIGIYGGNVTAADINGHEGSLSLTGGTITASSLTVDQGDIELGGATVTAGSYNVTQGNVTILPGITYYDGTGASYTAGDLSAADISAIAGKKLRTYDYRTVSYVKADGTTGSVDAIPLDNTMTTISAGWYVVNSDVTFSGDLSTNADDEVHIILCDGATLTANNITPIGHSDYLRIYGQSQSTGTANISGRIVASSSLQIYGGTINVTGKIMCRQSGVGIYGGNVTTAEINGYDGSLYLTGGTITAGSLIVDQGDITLGGATVTAGSYNVTQGNVTILPGITYYDGTGASYTAGNLTSGQISAIAGKTLRTHDYRGGDIGNENNVTWAVIDTDNNGTYETLTISGTGAMLTNPWSSYKNDITTVVINNGVTGINMSVFMNTPNLTSVTIPASVSYIGQQVFDGCTNLETVSGCEGVTDVGNDAFSGTKWLMDQPDGVIYIGKVAYLGKNVSGEVNIKAGTVSISSNAFNDCTSLTSITIPNSVTYIGSYTFYGCTGLISIEIPNSVTNIGDNAFQDCTSLTSITIPNGVTDIGDNAFQDCTSLTSITIPNSVTYIGSSAFYGCTSLPSITIPNNVIFIQSEAFYGCSNLETVTVYATTPPTLGNDAFTDCDADLQIYVFSDYVNNYNDGNWSNYYNAGIIKGMTGGYCGADDPQTYEDESKNVIWVLSGTSPDYTLTISGTGAMKDYGAPDDQPWKDYRSSITSVVIENGVTSIGDFAFQGCSNLAIVYMQSSTPQITTWGTDAFANLVIAVPAAAYNSYYTALEGNSYQSMLRKNIATCSATVPNPIYHSSYTHSYFYDGTWNDNHGGIVVYDGETLLTYYHYDSEIEGFVGDYRFSMLESLDGGNCENLNEHCRVYLEGMGAYAGTLYKDVEIVPATVTNAKWGDLTWNLDASGNFTITGTGAMKSADTFRNYDWYNYSSYFTSITIGNGITTVAAAAFGGNSNTNPYASVTSVSLPESLTTIGESAFAYCTGASFNADDLIAQGVTYGANSFNQVGCLVGTLANNADNTEKIALLYQAARANVTLQGRTLYKDGAWNTIVLPFDIADINAKEEEVYTCPLHGATVMELDVDNKWAMVNSEWAIDNVNGTMQTGLVDGTLNLFFKPATSIESGKPYIIKWASGSNLENPVFNSVPVFVDNHNATSSDGKVVFKGTYGPVTWNTETKSILFLGDENKLYFPQPSGDDIPHLGAFRAYFELDPTAHVREFNLNFEDGTQTTGIIGHTEITEITEKADAAWYSLDGRKLEGKPSSKGIYIHGGRKVVIK